jgi:uncharacterized glyoxalase superfamily protein PhnB
VLKYPSVVDATRWIVDVLGFRERLLIGPGHRAQLTFGDGSLVIAEDDTDQPVPAAHKVTASVMLRVDDAAEVLGRAIDHGAVVLHSVRDHPYGERQCTFRDPGGHVWTLTQTIKDVAPSEWGGIEG